MHDTNKTAYAPWLICCRQ